MSSCKSVEITGSSPESVWRSIDRVLARASETLRHLDWFEVTNVRGITDDDGSVTHYAATLKLGFRASNGRRGAL